MSGLGRARTVALVLAVQVLLLGVALVSVELAVVLAAGTVAALVVLERPVVGVGLIVASRVIGNEGLTIARVGPVGLGLYEAVALLSLPAVLHVLLKKRTPLVVDWPWRTPFALLLGWGALSLLWSREPMEGLGDLLPSLPVLYNTTLILVFVRTWPDLRAVLWCWLGGAVLVCLATIVLNLAGIDVGSVSFQAAAGGGRETGLGQQPNWFAMTLYFIVPTGFALALFERGWRRLLVLGSSLLVFLVMVSSGSRGGLAATAIALLVASLGSPAVRSWMLRLGFGAVAALGLAFVVDGGGISRAIGRIAAGAGVMANVRPWNWEACTGMFLDSSGLGIGLGGYSSVLAAYNPWLAQSIYDYPHGVFWQVGAHLGLLGLVLLGWLVLRVVRMQLRSAREAPSSRMRALVLVMSGTLAGYAGWTFFEFTLLEKPFFEFLALSTALALQMRREPT